MPLPVWRESARAGASRRGGLETDCCIFDFYNHGIMKTATIADFYKETSALIPEGISKEIGHFNVFDIADVMKRLRKKQEMPYNRRQYYKISLIRGHNRAEYADKVIEIEKNALLFATPKIPYHYVPYNTRQAGHFCIFTSEFLSPSKTGILLDELPIFKVGGFPVFEVTEEHALEISAIFNKMSREIASDYAYKYDLIRNYVLELIHYGQKLQPATALSATHTASSRISSLFAELLERQFPIESTQQQLMLRTPNDYAKNLAVHVNHLNKVLKEQTGRTTTAIITERVIQEAKVLLKHTDWNISDIAYCLGFEEIAHFSNFFRKETKMSPLSFRS